MIKQILIGNINWLTQKNYKIFYLSVLRVFVCFWLLKEVWINWSSMDMFYGKSAFVITNSDLSGRLHEGAIAIIRHYYFWYINLFIVIIFMNLLGIGKSFVALLLFTMTYILQRLYIPFFNGGDMMARLILFYLIFADSYQYFVLRKSLYSGDRKLGNLVSNLAAFSIMLQLCLSYFASGFAKLNDTLWLHGEAVYYTLLNERYMGMALNQQLAQIKWLDITINYLVLFFELLFPFLIWVKKLRKPFLFAGIILHMSIYIFLMIYGFQIVFVIIYGLFLPNDRLFIFWQKIKNHFINKSNNLFKKSSNIF